jgi:hypothetical protein
MKRTLSNLVPALLLAVAILAATALAAAAPHAPWTAAAGPLLLALAIAGTDLIQRRHGAGRRFLPSPSALLLAAAILAASGIVASGGVARLAAAMPILGTGASLPVILRPAGAHTSCWRA